LTKIISASPRHPSRSLPRFIRPSRATSLNSIRVIIRKRPSRKANSQWPWLRNLRVTGFGKTGYWLRTAAFCHWINWREVLVRVLPGVVGNRFLSHSQPFAALETFHTRQFCVSAVESPRRQRASGCFETLRPKSRHAA
jgi:hypothetical protein